MASAALNPTALAAAGILGTWVTDVAAGLSILDGRAAATMAGDDRLAGQPMRMQVALGRIHPEDRDWVFGRIRQARLTGGPFSAEFRVLDHDGNVRWILNRGCLRPDEAGAMHGCGAYIDTTDSHRNLLFPQASKPVGSPAPHGLDDPLDEAAGHVLRARTALERSGHGSLRGVVDLLLIEIGRALARRMRA